jgi:hypothetical protein
MFACGELAVVRRTQSTRAQVRCEPSSHTRITPRPVLIIHRHEDIEYSRRCARPSSGQLRLTGSGCQTDIAEGKEEIANTSWQSHLASTTDNIAHSID